MDTQCGADLAVAHALLTHGKNVSAKLHFARIAEIALGCQWYWDVELEYMPS